MRYDQIYLQIIIFTNTGEIAITLELTVNISLSRGYLYFLMPNNYFLPRKESNVVIIKINYKKTL